MHEVGYLPLPVDDVTALADGLGHVGGSAGEHAHLAHVAVLLLDELEEGGHVGPPEVVDGLEPGEHAPSRYPLEVVLADVEHRGTDVELVEELGDEDVHLQHVGDVLLLHVAQNVDEPLKVLVRWADPEEVDLKIKIVFTI